MTETATVPAREPLYRRVYHALHDQILAEHWPPGSLLPNEPTLAQQFSVSRVTIRRSLAELEREGLIERRRGHGTTVRSRWPSPPVHAEVSGFVASIKSLVAQTEVDLLHYDVAPVPMAVARTLEIEPESRALHMIRLRRFGGAPYCHQVNWLRADVADRLDRDDVATRGLVQVYEDLGLLPRTAEQRCFARAAGTTVASLLDVTASAPVLGVERIFRDAEGKPFDVMSGLYRADRFVFDMTMHLGG
jgi:GntR family transcriptional regulator